MKALANPEMRALLNSLAKTNEVMKSSESISIMPIEIIQ